MPEDGITLERIRERAYDIWDRNHWPDGFDVEFWLVAEREPRARPNAATLPQAAFESEGIGPRSP